MVSLKSLVEDLLVVSMSLVIPFFCSLSLVGSYMFSPLVFFDAAAVF